MKTLKVGGKSNEKKKKKTGNNNTAGKTNKKLENRMMYFADFQSGKVLNTFTLHSYYVILA